MLSAATTHQTQPNPTAQTCGLLSRSPAALQGPAGLSHPPDGAQALRSLCSGPTPALCMSTCTGPSPFRSLLISQAAQRKCGSGPPRKGS